MKGAWKILLPEVETDFENNEVERIRNAIMGMDVENYLSENDVEEFLTSEENPLHTEELLEYLSDQQNPENARSSPSEAEDERCTLTLEKMSTAFNLFYEAVIIFESSHPDKERFKIFREGVNNSLAVYKELYKETQRTSLVTNFRQGQLNTSD